MGKSVQLIGSIKLEGEYLQSVRYIGKTGCLTLAVDILFASLFAPSRPIEGDTIAVAKETSHCCILRVMREDMSHQSRKEGCISLLQPEQDSRKHVSCQKSRLPEFCNCDLFGPWQSDIYKDRLFARIAMPKERKIHWLSLYVGRLHTDLAREIASLRVCARPSSEKILGLYIPSSSYMCEHL